MGQMACSGCGRTGGYWRYVCESCGSIWCMHCTGKRLGSWDFNDKSNWTNCKNCGSIAKLKDTSLPIGVEPEYQSAPATRNKTTSTGDIIFPIIFWGVIGGIVGAIAGTSFFVGAFVGALITFLIFMYLSRA